MTDTPRDEPWLVSLAAAVSAGDAVDWAAARARASHDEAPVVEELHRLSQIVRGRSGEAAARGNGGGDGTWPAVRAWRTLLVLEPLASGFSGDVHRAWDTQLDREVAVKFLHPLADGTAPSVREARALARVRHPNVVTVYGVEHDSGQSGLWMELIDGETLADAVTARGPMSAREAAGIGIDVCRAVSALHAHGLVHRDIKAANVMREVGGRIVLMDFSGAHGIDDAHPPTLQGTPLYMAPELLAGERATPASDIYAIGVLLFFLLTGRHPVEGETLADLEAAHETNRRVRLLDARPDLPEALVRVVERAIAAPRDARYHTVGELEHALGAIFGGGHAARSRLALTGRGGGPRSRLATLGVGAAMLGLLLATGTLAWRGLTAGRAPAPPPIEFDMIVQEPLRLDPTSNDARVSPDGRVVVFSAWANGTQLLYRRAVGSRQIHPMVGTEGAALPFWSADSRFVGFHASGLLKRVPIEGGPVTNICPSRHFGGAAWNRDGVIVFSQVSSLWTVAADGGQPRQFPIPPETGPDAVAVAPAFRPDQRSFTYRIGFGDKDTTGTYLASLDGDAPSRRLFDLGPNVVLGERSVTWIANGSLHTQALDSATLTPVGPVTGIEGGILGNDGQAVTPGLSLSETGVLVYRRFGAAETQLGWFDLEGRSLGTLDAPRFCRNPEFSPSGDRVAVECTDPTTGRRDIWLVAEGSEPIRLTDSPGGASDPVWSPDGRQVAFSSNPRGTRDLFAREWATSGEPISLHGSPATKYPCSWSKDGTLLAFTERGMSRAWNIWTLDTRTRKARAVVINPFDDIEPQFSPDQRWLAYTSNRSGRWAVYVQDLQAPNSEARMVSAGLGESDPRWSPSGDRLYYLSGDRRLLALSTRSADGRPGFGPPTALFTSAAIGPIGIGLRFNYAVHPDGKRLLMLVGAGPRELPALTVRVGWTP